jgi:hypothetical protein
MDNILKYTIVAFIVSLFTWSVSHNLTDEENEINEEEEEDMDFSRGTNNPSGYKNGCQFASFARNYSE